MTDQNDARGTHGIKRPLLYLGLVALVACVAVAVSVPVALKGRGNGEHAKDAKPVHVSLLKRKARTLFDSETQVSVTLSDLYSSSSSSDSAMSLDDDRLNSSATIYSDTNTSTTNTNATDYATGNSTEMDAGESGFIRTAEPITDFPSASPTEMVPTPAPGPQLATVVGTYTIHRVIPHDPNAFTQGLTFDPLDSSVVYESTGLYGRSDVRKVNIDTGEVLMLTDTSSDLFGEGLAFYTTQDPPPEGRLIHITWKSQRGFIYDSDTLTILEEFRFSTVRNEGWGITYNPRTDQFIVTDGSHYLHFWDRDLNEVERIPVTMQLMEGGPQIQVTNLNEIEWDDDTQTLLSNVWQTNNILRIDPVTGTVITLYDMSQLYPNRPNSADVLNGIAISPTKDLWVTGKLWPNMYLIEFIER